MEGWPKTDLKDLVLVQGDGNATRVKALRAYTAQRPEELSFPQGAILFVVKQVDDKFFSGQVSVACVLWVVCVRACVRGYMPSLQCDVLYILTHSRAGVYEEKLGLIPTIFVQVFY